jgi:selenocysteine-specific elongation factor
MRYITLATAGHVDHGKTSLIKALTSIDTDRLPEEKERGMSIDIGFAFLDFDGIRVEIIDIPGHERFIRNAIAGLSSVQGVLLVIDANEGPMPQTKEHIKLIKSFGIDHCLVVLTKIDKCEDLLVEIVKEETERLLSKEGIKCFGFYPVSSVQKSGLEELKEGIYSYVRNIKEPDCHAFFRMNIDSAFHVKGYGTVLRGSCVAGTVREGDTLSLEPVGLLGRVRKMQNHGRFVKEGRAGERLALNIPEMDAKLVERGFWLVKKDELGKTNVVLVSAEGLKPGKEYIFFFGMKGVLGLLRHVQEDVYLVRLSQKVVCVRGDKGPVLDTSGIYAGSFTVLDPIPKRISKSFIRNHINLLRDDLISYQMLEAGIKGLKIKDISASLGRAVNPQHIAGVRINDRIYSQGILKEVQEKLTEFLEKHGGMVKLAQLKSKLRLEEDVLSYLLKERKDIKRVEDYLLSEKKSKVEELESFKRLMETMKSQIKEDKELIDFKDLLPIAIKKGYIHSLGEFLYIGDTLFKELVEKLRQIGETFSVQQAKERLGLTRKYLIPLLEYMDRKGLTVREGDVRRFIR